MKNGNKLKKKKQIEKKNKWSYARTPSAGTVITHFMDFFIKLRIPLCMFFFWFWQSLRAWNFCSERILFLDKFLKPIFLINFFRDFQTLDACNCTSSLNNRFVLVNSSRVIFFISNFDKQILLSKFCQAIFVKQFSLSNFCQANFFFKSNYLKFKFSKENPNFDNSAKKSINSLKICANVPWPLFVFCVFKISISNKSIEYKNDHKQINVSCGYQTPGVNRGEMWKSRIES